MKQVYPYCYSLHNAIKQAYPYCCSLHNAIKQVYPCCWSFQNPIEQVGQFDTCANVKKEHAVNVGECDCCTAGAGAGVAVSLLLQWLVFLFFLYPWPFGCTSAVQACLLGPVRPGQDRAGKGRAGFQCNLWVAHSRLRGEGSSEGYYSTVKYCTIQRTLMHVPVVRLCIALLACRNLKLLWFWWPQLCRRVCSLPRMK